MNKLLITSAVAIALSISACSEQKTPEQLIASANNHSEQGKFSDAIIEFKNAVRLAPKNADARLGLGKAYLNQGNYISAEKELERARALGANFSLLAPLLAHVKTRLDKFSDVELLLKTSEDLKDQDYLVVLTYAGISALSTGQITKAQDYFSQAGAIDNNAEYSQLASAYLLYSERNFADGLTKVADILSTNNGFTEAKLLQGYLHFSSKAFIEASQVFFEYIVRYPLDYNVQFFQVNTLIKAQQFEQADKLANKLLKTFKKSPLALQYKAQIEYQKGNYIAAREFASQAVGLDGSFVIAKIVAGVSSYKLDELEQAYDYLIGLENMLPATHPINVILLSIKVKLGQTDELATSVARLEELRNSESDSDLLQVTSLELMKVGNYATAQTLLNKAAQVAPNSARIKVKQGALLLTQGDLSGIQSLEQALTIDPSLHETEFALASQYIQNNEISKAQAIADKWLLSEEYQIPGYLLSGMIALKEEEELKAETNFNNVLSIDKNNVTALYGLASVYGFKKQTANAISGYEKVLELNPNHYEAIRKYNSLQATQGSTAAAISFLNTLHEKSKLNGRIHKNLLIGIALNLIRSKQQVDAITLLESIKGESNLPVKYWSILANTYALNKQYDKAPVILEEGVKINSHSYALRVAHIGALERIRKSSEALVITRQANKDFPNDESLIATLAYLELVNKNIEAAKKQLKALNKLGVLIQQLKLR